MKYFIDSANLPEIDDVLRSGVARGLTTNPSLVRSHAQGTAFEHLKDIVALVERKEPQWSISVQVMTRNPDLMLKQGLALYRTLDYKKLAIKIPCSWEAFPVIRELARNGITVNCTACASLNQALLAAAAGASYVSMFYGKMTDSGIDAATTVGITAVRLADYGSQLIVGSLRRTYDVFEVARAGVHIVTVPYEYLKKISQHEKTDEAVERFARDFLPFYPE
ncbi:MAG TPA: transaldolase family protein [Streptosporangiaceae bacterium]